MCGLLPDGGQLLVDGYVVAALEFWVVDYNVELLGSGFQGLFRFP